MDRRDWLLAAIATAGDRGLTPIQIQKAMFLLKKEAPDYVGERFYDFVPYNYGPFSSVIYGDVDGLVFAGAVLESPSGRYSVYRATESGQERAAASLERIDKRARQYLETMVSWVSNVDFRQLLRSIYAKYPEYAEKSVFRT